MTEPSNYQRPLSSLHDRSIAIELIIDGRIQIVVGRGIYDESGISAILRIQLTGDADAEIVIDESAWNGEIVPGEAAGCEFLIRLRSPPDAAG